MQDHFGLAFFLLSVYLVTNSSTESLLFCLRTRAERSRRREYLVILLFIFVDIEINEI